MNTDFLYRLLVLADDAGKAAGDAAANPQPPSLLSYLPLFAIIFVLFYLMMIRPQKKEQQKRADLLNNLKKNDRVVTIGGIYGTVMNAKRENDEVVLKVDETNDTKIRVIYSAIARVITDEPANEKKDK